MPLIAVKRLHSPLKDDFDKEASMLNSIARSDHPHIIKLLATYHYKGHYHLLFPWAPCNLRGFWINNPKPRWDRISVLWMLEQLKGLTSGLCEVHNFKIDNPGTSKLQLPAIDRTRLYAAPVGDIRVAEDELRYGRHGDLKPENILWSDELEGVDKMGVLQIADFGLGRFHGRESRSEIPPKSVIASPTYEPPEIPLDEKVSRAYDIWSLGCIFLEFVTWYLGGLPLINEFHDLKMVDGGDETVNDKFFTLTNYKEPGRQDAVVRKEVLDWIQELRKLPHCSQALQELLTLVKERMLVIRPKQRINCKNLLDDISQLLSRVRNDDFLLLGDIQKAAGANSPRTPLFYGQSQVYILNRDEEISEMKGTPEIIIGRPSEEEQEPLSFP